MSYIFDETIRAVMFDLDGTLVDTAPDMVSVLQDLQRDRGVEPVAYDFGRSSVSNGALGLLNIAFPDADESSRESLLSEYLTRYALQVCSRTQIFGGLDTLLQRLDEAERPWGIVTNKPAYLTDPLLRQLGLTARMVCAVSGDTLPRRKPHPDPLLHACSIAGVRPAETLYVGDARRDIEAGRRAGMPTIAAAYGYITSGDDPLGWGADAIAADTAELTQIVLKAVNLIS